MQQQSMMISHRLFVFLIMWPLGILAVVLTVFFAAGKNTAAQQRDNVGQSNHNSPTGAVRMLWEVQESIYTKYDTQLGGKDISRLLSKDTQMKFEQAQRMFTEKQIDSTRKLDADRYSVNATYTISPAHRSDDDQTVSRTYILTKDAGHWKIAEVRAGCTSCGGRGEESCYMCSGDGEEYDDVCSTCDGTGKKKCDPCKGVGWTDYVKEGESFLLF